MQTKLLSQCVLESGNQRLVAWLSAEKIKPGFSVTLKDSSDPKRWWNVIHMSQLMEEKYLKTSHDAKAIFEKDYHGRVNRLNVF